MNKLIAGFAIHPEPVLSDEQCTIGTALGTRLQRIVRMPFGWRLWIATSDYVHGTYLDLYHHGMVLRTTTREDEGDEVYEVRPSDNAIRYGWKEGSE